MQNIRTNYNTMDEIHTGNYTNTINLIKRGKEKNKGTRRSKISIQRSVDNNKLLYERKLMRK